MPDRRDLSWLSIDLTTPPHVGKVVCLALLAIFALAVEHIVLIGHFEHRHAKVVAATWARVAEVAHRADTARCVFYLEGSHRRQSLSKGP
jgi:hypothetical protein